MKRKLSVILLLCSVCLYGESLPSKSKRLLLASFAAVTAAEIADSAASWHKMEMNPVLGRSRFGMGQAGIKIGVVSAVLAGQYLLLRRRSPSAYRAVALVNFAGAGALGAIAIRNARIATPVE